LLYSTITNNTKQKREVRDVPRFQRKIRQNIKAKESNEIALKYLIYPLGILIILNQCIGRTLANDEYILRSEHGVVFENVGIVNNDLTNWYQTFVIPLTHVDLKNTEYTAT
jgi:hypothetical protein